MRVRSRVKILKKSSARKLIWFGDQLSVCEKSKKNLKTNCKNSYFGAETIVFQIFNDRLPVIVMNGRFLFIVYDVRYLIISTTFSQVVFYEYPLFAWLIEFSV